MLNQLLSTIGGGNDKIFSYKIYIFVFLNFNSKHPNTNQK